MTTLLVVGTTGLVGTAVRRQARDDPRVGRVVALSRRPLDTATEADGQATLENHVLDFGDLPADAPWWAVDAVICTLGTTMAKAGSKRAFRRVDYDYPLAVARHARAAGTPAFVLNSALGASARSPFVYSRTKGELEQDLRACHYPSLTFVRPGLIGGQRNEHRPMEQLAVHTSQTFARVLPRRLRVNPAERVAAALLEAALAAAPGVHTVESDQLTD